MIRVLIVDDDFMVAKIHTGFVARTPVALVDGLRDFRSLEQLERHFDTIDEVLIADADFPAEEAVELVDRCHQQGAAAVADVAAEPPAAEVLRAPHQR